MPLNARPADVVIPKLWNISCIETQFARSPALVEWPLWTLQCKTRPVRCSVRRKGLRVWVQGVWEPYQGWPWALWGSWNPSSFAYSWTCVLSTFLSSEYRVPGPDPFFRKTEATVPVLGMSSFSGENRKQMIKGYIVRWWNGCFWTSELRGPSIKRLIETKPPEKNLNPCV